VGVDIAGEWGSGEQSAQPPEAVVSGAEPPAFAIFAIFNKNNSF